MALYMSTDTPPLLTPHPGTQPQTHWDQKVATGVKMTYPSSSAPTVKWSEAWWVQASAEAQAHRCIAHQKTATDANAPRSTAVSVSRISLDPVVETTILAALLFRLKIHKETWQGSSQ
ncbi:MAG: hypothetical protein ACRDTS_13195 [Mycobacterium sp.]